MRDFYEFLRTCHLKRYWTRGVAGFAWLALAWITAEDVSPLSPEFLGSAIWAVGAAMIGIVTLLHWIAGTHFLRYAVALGTMTYAISRGWGYAQVGIWAPFSIWLIVAAVTLSAYRSSMRGGTGSD